MDPQSELNDGRFAGKVALVTGSAAGIGAAISERLAREGASVVLTGRRGELLEARAAALRAEGLEALALAGDITSDAATIVDRAVNHYGRLDVLVANAGASAGMPIDEMTFALWRQVMAVNLDAVFEMVRHALPLLAATHGNVLLISSISTVSGEFDDAAYAASKAGVEAFGRKLVLEWAAAGVRSNVIRPGLILTEAFAGMPPDFFDSQIPLIPLGRTGKPEEIAAAAAFLCSDEAAFITGAVLTIDGGESAK
jgi:NAD(P)-dependent dehydrogenase (short-subunit alcohol dehydrogenase family)